MYLILVEHGSAKMTQSSRLFTAHVEDLGWYSNPRESDASFGF